MVKNGRASQILFHTNKDKVIILIHCFRCNPLIFSELESILYLNGFSVFNLRLPGHGLENEKEILSISLHDWQVYIENIFLDLADNFKQVFFCGLSLGASLIVNLAIKYSQYIKKIILLNPIFILKQKYAFLGGLLKIFIKQLKPSRVDCSVNSELFSEFISIFPLPQGYEIYKLVKKIKKNIKELTVKGICFLSKNDHDLNFQENKNIIEQYTSFEIKVLNKSYHQITIDKEKDRVNELILDYLIDIKI